MNFGAQQETGEDEEEDEEGELEEQEEVVLITGGCNGLGRLLAEIYGVRGVSVAVLDVREPEGGKERTEEEEGWKWYKCDVGHMEEVQSVKAEIEKDVCILFTLQFTFSSDLRSWVCILLCCAGLIIWCIQLGKPTILINNAASRIGGVPLCALEGPSLDQASIDRTFNTNVHGHFNTLRAFLPGIVLSPNGGTIVTISSILAHLAPASLTDYAASKAAVSALHHSITHELRQQGLTDRVKTVLVETGQINTDLFRGVETPSNFFGPILDTREVAKQIVRLIDDGEGGLIRMPAYARWIEWLIVLPAGLHRLVRWASGIDVALGAHDRGRTNGAAAAAGKI